jgi:hypothetical protein
MNTKHTPGPWLIADSNFVYALHEHKGRQVNRFSASIDHYPTQGGSAEEGRANARLIAAAPELFESTEILSGFVSALCESFGIEDDLLVTVTPKDGSPAHKVSLCDAIKGAIAAIAKATGKEPA